LQIEPLLERRPAQLSGGQRQRVAMGRALARQPQIFLFDEPLSNLDAKLRVEMRAEIKRLHQLSGITSVYVTHDQIEAMTMADRIVVMHDGIIEQIGTPLELFDRPGNLFVAQFIGSPSMNVFKARLRVADGRTWVEALGHEWPAQALAQGRDGQAVAYGMRPTDVVVSKTGSGIPAKVIVVEPTGAETELLLDVGGERMIIVMHGRTDARPDDIVHLEIAAGKAHLFDDATSQRLE
ncbi:MAG: ATP-binding cassette domain-containing protein, partial [Burkholderiaceae bacterium]|nr:ATP-binding cassette domain-containing protein [Burkholderiaceae bacterium]